MTLGVLLHSNSAVLYLKGAVNIKYIYFEIDKIILEACSHGRAHEFFLESIDSTTGFFAYPCENWKDFERGECRNDAALMGDPAMSDHRGDFYLHTKDNAKYAMGSEF